MADLRLRHARARSIALIMLVLVLLLGLPLAVWLDLQNLTNAALRRQASDLNSVITSMRGFYGSHVVGRVLAAPPGTTTQVTHNYEAIPGAIPIPATLSLELWPRHQRAAAEHHLQVRVPGIHVLTVCRGEAWMAGIARP